MIVLLIYIYSKYEKFSMSKILNYSIHESEYKSTIFEIFDKSTKTTCDRLIIVKPFGWYIWAINNELYILNPENGMSCGAGSTPAVKILKDLYINCCLRLDYDSIINSYSNSPKIIVDYTINDKTFTIFSALNILVKKYIKFDINSVQATLNEIEPLNTNVETSHYEYISSLRGKKLLPEHIVRMMAIHEPINNDLHEAYAQHISIK